MNMRGRGGGWNSPNFNQGNNWNWSNGKDRGRGGRGGGGNWNGGGGGGGRGFRGGRGGGGGYGRGFQHNGPRPPMGMNAWSADGNGGDFGGPGPQMDGPGPMGPPVGHISPKQVLGWLDGQDPVVLRRVMYHCKWVLEKRGLPVESVGFTDVIEEGFLNEATPVPGAGPGGEEGGDMSGWYEGATKDDPADGGEGGPPMKKGALFMGGMRGMRGGRGRPPPGIFGPPGMGPMGPMGGPVGMGGPSGPMQWTPAGWVPKDNSHKVTTTIKEMPAPDVIPNVRDSEKYPEADADRNKLRMLENNKRMMDIEVHKICRKHRIFNLDKDNLDQYPDEAKTRLKTALTCVNSAEKTLTDFRDFLKEEKYKEFNDEQSKKYDESLKSMIGDMPQGVPHKKAEESEEQEEEQAAQE